MRTQKFSDLHMILCDFAWLDRHIFCYSGIYVRCPLKTQIGPWTSFDFPNQTFFRISNWWGWNKFGHISDFLNENFVRIVKIHSYHIIKIRS